MLNWAATFGHAVPWPLDHLWTLSVEEQFYLVWPFTLMFLVRKLPARTALLITIGAALLSWSARAFVWSPSREGVAYASTFTRADGLLLGCALGQAYARRLFDPFLRALRHPAVGYAALVAILVLIPFSREDRASAYYFTITAASVASLLLVGHLVGNGVQAQGGVARLLGCGVMTAIGRRAYSIYLWQGPVMFWLTGPLDQTSARWPVNIGATLICAELSYRFIEIPFLRGRVRGARRGRSRGLVPSLGDPHPTSPDVVESGRNNSSVEPIGESS